MKIKKQTNLKKFVKVFLIIGVIFLLINFVYTIYENTMTEYVSNNLQLDDNLNILTKLKKLSQYDKRINTIIANYEKYPELLLEMLTKDLDMLDFVIEYPQNLGKVSSDNVGNIKKGTIPLLLQWDKRWGYGKYGNSSIALSGCGPTALSMVYVGLTEDVTMTPYKIARFAEENNYFLNDLGTSWYLMTDGATKLGLKSKEISLSKTSIFNALENGHPIICSMRKGDFTTTGHFIVLTDIKNGKIKLNDPNSQKRSNMLWEYEKLQSQIKNLWEFSI